MHGALIFPFRMCIHNEICDYRNPFRSEIQVSHMIIYRDTLKSLCEAA